MNRQARHLATFGYVVLPRHIDPPGLADEFDRTMTDAFADHDYLVKGAIGNRFRYVPTMCEHTPISLGLVVELADIARELLGCAVLPGRAKATVYVGSAKWHRDTDLAVRSLGFVAYLEPLTADTGALRVIPGSHAERYAGEVKTDPVIDPTLPGRPLATQPGDVIVFDEHLYHSSVGGGPRRQWRIDFIADDVTDEALSEWYAQQYSVGWDAGYDLDRYPSYGAHWQTINQHWNQRLTQLGAYNAAHAEEVAARTARRKQ